MEMFDRNTPVSQPQARSHICLGTAVGGLGASLKRKLAWGQGNFDWDLLWVRLHLHLLSEDGHTAPLFTMVCAWGAMSQCLGTCDL